MVFQKTLLPIALLTVFAAGCAPPKAAKPYPTAEPALGDGAPEPAPVGSPSVAKPQGIARYFERRVDLAPFLAGYPYGRFHPSLETKRLFFFEMGQAYALKMFDLEQAGSGAWDLAGAKTISDVDWSKRSLWSVHHHAQSNTLWLHADASNDEQMNLWTLDLRSQTLEQVTKNDYVYGFGFSEDEKQIAYLPRTGTKAPYRTCLQIRDVATGQEREVLCDSAALTFTWSNVKFSPSGEEVYFSAQVKGDRTRVQVVRVDLNAAKPKAQPITNPKVSRNSPEALDGWRGDEFYFVANDDGFGNLFAYDRVTKNVRQITRFKEDLTSARIVGDQVVGVHETPAGSTLVLVDSRSGDTVDERKFTGSVSVDDAHGEDVYVTQTSPDIFFAGYSMKISRPELGELESVIALDRELEKAIVQCKATPVQIPTFDVDKATGKTRELHAFLLEPRTPIEEPAAALAMITAFYGGSNAYSKFDNIMCAAGLTVLSPAVRGSTGFGKDFYSLNDKDLGGSEIVDLFYAARWLEERTGLPSSRIGVAGGSHGGYATMRALTFQPETNGHNESYALGFGMSHAGFSDIKTFYDATNIPDWVVLESGDPNRPADLARMNERSPLQQVERLRAPLLLTHGSQDWRVPVAESRQFAAAAKAAKRPVNYVEIEGQGHHIEGLDLEVKVYQARFDFLAAVAKAAAGP